VKIKKVVITIVDGQNRNHRAVWNGAGECIAGDEDDVKKMFGAFQDGDVEDEVVEEEKAPPARESTAPQAALQGTPAGTGSKPPPPTAPASSESSVDDDSKPEDDSE
jgi:hypothetical protein